MSALYSSSFIHGGRSNPPNSLVPPGLRRKRRRGGGGAELVGSPSVEASVRLVALVAMVGALVEGLSGGRLVRSSLLDIKTFVPRSTGLSIVKVRVSSSQR